MATKNINTSTSVKEAAVTDVQIKGTLNEQMEKFKNEPKVKISIPKALEARLGAVYEMGINGVMVVVPIDGKVYEVNQTHAEHIMERLALLD